MLQRAGFPWSAPRKEAWPDFPRLASELRGIHVPPHRSFDRRRPPNGRATATTSVKRRSSRIGRRIVVRQ